MLENSPSCHIVNSPFREGAIFHPFYQLLSPKAAAVWHCNIHPCESSVDTTVQPPPVRDHKALEHTLSAHVLLYEVFLNLRMVGGSAHLETELFFQDTIEGLAVLTAV